MTNLEPLFLAYIALWGLASLVALAIVLRQPSDFAFTHPEYRRFLGVPWKLATFLLAAATITLIAPYTGDSTWDWFDGLFMSLLAFAGAPWVVGVLWLSARRKAPAKQLYVALCLWLFSASWSYDLYILLRDGHYPLTWLPNIFASSVLYLSGGLMWNLDWHSGRGLTLSFLEPDWPAAAPARDFGKLFWLALPFMIICATALLWFFLP